MYKEVQKFRQWWFLALDMVLLIIAIIAFVQQIIFGIPFGNHPMSDRGLFFFLAFMFALPILLYYTNLTIEVRPDGLYVRYWPFHLRFRKIEYTDCKAATYRPLLDYGGWGIKWGPKGMVYNVSGNKGVLFTRMNGKKLMIGSKTPEELVKALSAKEK